MNSDTDIPRPPSLVRPLPILFLGGLIVTNLIAIFQYDPFYIGSLFAFLYIIIVPGFLLLPFLTSKKMSPMLGITFSATLSTFLLMLVGLGVNTALPFFGIHQPLTTIPLLIAFNALIYILLVFNFLYQKISPFEFHEFNGLSWTIAGASLLLPILACLGADMLNNGGSNILTMIALALACVLVPVILFDKDKMSPSTPPLTLYLMALSFLLMNSMRGWFISGHDILLEYHVFTLTNANHLWNMAFYQDPYMACLSITILPTFLQSLLHVSPAYIFKFFTQFLGAFPVVVVYYLTKEYTSKKIAFLTAFLYISFPTFLVDMAFLNRQGIAFLFFGTLLFVLLTSEHFNGWKRTFSLFILGTGVIISHYSTSYVAIAVLVAAYIINWIIYGIANIRWPRWFSGLTDRLGNKETYQRPILLTLPFVLGLLVIMLLWSTVITKTSSSFFDTIGQIVTTVEHPFSLDEYSGPAKYNLLQSQQESPQQMFDGFLQDSISQSDLTRYPSAFYPLSITESYPAVALAETTAPITPFGEVLQAMSHIDLVSFFNAIKQVYAKILQLLLLIGVLGMAFGYSFRKNIIHDIPREYLSLSIAGIIILVGQTILPPSAIDYGLLRLFQQNLIFLALPIVLGLLAVVGVVARTERSQLVISTIIFIFFFVILSGLFPQLTGGSRPPLPLDNSGLYYDSYYTHAQEVASVVWLAENQAPNTPIEAANFSNMKMLAFGQIGADIELLPETIKRNAYIYLNYNNVQTSNILEIINGNVIYYHFPMEFLSQYKNLIYNDNGSEIYH